MSTVHGTQPYGLDPITKNAQDVLRKHFFLPEADVFFVVSGTAANALALSYYVSPGDIVLTPSCSHINTLEANAPERFRPGIRVMACGEKGKIKISDIHQTLRQMPSAHAEQKAAIRVVMISNPNECGETYGVEEIRELRDWCDKHNVALGIDGARALFQAHNFGEELGAAFQLADFVTLSATKIGGILGAAIIFPHGVADHGRFRRELKGYGHILDSTSLIASQFIGLFSDNQVTYAAQQAVALAQMLRSRLSELGLSVYPGASNCVLVHASPELAHRMSEYHLFYSWGATDDGQELLRFMIAVTHEEQDVQRLISDFRHIIDGA
jgi:threonine aldolase